MVWLRSRDDTLSSCKLYPSLESWHLGHCLSFDKPELMKVADYGCHTMVAKPAGMDRGWYESMPQSIHFYYWCHPSYISVVPGVWPLSHAGASCRLDIDDAEIRLFALDFILDEG